MISQEKSLELFAMLLPKPVANRETSLRHLIVFCQTRGGDLIHFTTTYLQRVEVLTMQHFLSLVVCVLFVTCHLLGCQDPVDVPSKEETDPVEALKPASIARQPTAEETFAKLRLKFPNAILDDDFKTLRKVTTSKTYLDFIRQEYPTGSPFQTLEAYFQVAPPDAERYTTFLKEWIDRPTKRNIDKFHRVTVEYRCANIILFRITNLPPQNRDQDIRRIFEKKIGLIKIGVIEEIGLHKWLVGRALGEKTFFHAFEEFVAETEREDAMWLHEQFEVRNGVDDGLLWSALLKPALIGEILTNFSDPDLFLTWIDKRREIE